MVASPARMLDRKLIRDLWAFRGQASSIVLVLACAMAAATMSFSVLRSLDATREDYYRRNGFADLFVSVPHAPQSFVEIVSRIPGVLAVAGRVVGYGALSVDGFDEPVTGRLVSLPDKDGPLVNGLDVRQGRLPAPDRPQEVLVNESFALAHGLGPGARLTATIGGYTSTLTIVGIALSPEYTFALGPGQIVPDDRRFALVWIERSTLAMALDLPDEVNDLAIRLGPGVSAAGVSEAVRQLLTPYGGGSVHDRTRQHSHAFVSSQLEELGAVGVIVPAIFLGVAVFLLHASLLRLVELQRPEIGIVKALGFAGRTIGWHYAKFALALAGAAIVLGLPIGLLLGHIMTGIYAEFFHFPFLAWRPDWPAFLATAFVVGCTAIVAAWHPASRAAALQPAIAMRPALPMGFRRGPGEPLLHPLGAPVLMAARQVARRPLGPLLTTAAVAFAVGLQIATLFSFDALDEIIDVFYARSQRQDATIVSAAPVPITMLEEAIQRPGVRAIEGFLDVPSRLSVRGRSRDAVLTGLPADSTLRRLLDPELEPMAVPRDAIALSRRLARILDAHVGDRVKVDTVAGRSFELPVAAIVEQYIGLGAYMELGALGRLTGMGPVITGAAVKLADTDPSAFYRTLKDQALVAGFAPRVATIGAFRHTMARTLTIIVSFFVAFAAIAAFAIVDATVRVTLSERIPELTIMRALGFGNGTVVLMLAGELAMAVVAALPLGVVVGLGLGGLMVWSLDNDLFHVPLVVGWRSYTIAGGTVLAAATIAFALAARRLRGVDIPAALRTAAT